MNAELPNTFAETSHIQRRWSQLAGGFCRTSATSALFTRESEDLILNGLVGLEPQRILDLACGVGNPTIRLAAEFPRAQVVGVDFVDEMLTEVRRRAVAANLDNVKAVSANLLQLPFDDDEFSAVTVRFGLQYYDDALRLRMLREAVRVLEPGGRLVIVDWGPEGHGAAKRFYLDILRQYKETAHADDASTPFELKSQAQFASFLRKVGVRDVDHRYPEVGWNWQGSPAALWQHVMSFTTQLPELMAALDPYKLATINERVVANLSQFTRGDCVRLPVRNLVLVGVV